MKKFDKKSWISILGVTAASSLMTLSTAQAEGPYELWFPDQSNSVHNVANGKGTLGGFLNIIDHTHIDLLAPPGDLAGSPALPLKGCRTPFSTSIPGDANAAPVGAQTTGPCDINLMFPNSGAANALTACSGVGSVSIEGTLGPIGRPHHTSPDQLHKYMSITFFTPGGGYVGIINGDTKQAVGLWRVTGTSAPSGGGRSAHMSFWTYSGAQLIVANLHGRMLERIDIDRNDLGDITSANFNRGVSLGLAGESINTDAVAYQDDASCNGGGTLISTVSGNYHALVTNPTFTSFSGPGGASTKWCKQDGCNDPGAFNGDRPSNLPIGIVVADTDIVYATMRGGGALIVDATRGLGEDMVIVGHYGRTDDSSNFIDGTQGLNGSLYGGVQVGPRMFLNSGVSPSPVGASQSTFTVQALPVAYTPEYDNFIYPYNFPGPLTATEDGSNTQTGGNSFGFPAVPISQIVTDTSGEVLNAASRSVRRDARSMTAADDTLSYIHVLDGIQNTVDVINPLTPGNTFSPYDLMSADGYGDETGPCLAMSVTDDPLLPLNDPAGGLMAASPHKNVHYVALRGPAPVTDTHSAQGSCPGVGVIDVKLVIGNPNYVDTSGKHGYLLKVIRTSNLDLSSAGAMTGGVNYAGSERSDINSVAVREY